MGTAEGKLLHTLHWILLDAADECALAMGNEGKLDSSPFAYLFPITAITVRIYDAFICFDLKYVERFCDFIKYGPYMQHLGKDFQLVAAHSLTNSKRI